MSKKIILVVPCYNEEKRLDAAGFEAIFSKDGVSVLFVDDGSNDRTADRIREICAQHPQATDFLGLPKNRGKAEAIRRGMLKAMEARPYLLGYLDADLSTPPEDIRRIIARAGEEDCKVVIGSRVKLLGAEIDRSGVRHLLGRAFATLASLSLGIGVYDTQCGAKLFANSPALLSAMQKPFLSRWAFDVELIARLLYPDDEAVEPIRLEEIVELPLKTWRDVKGSKLGLKEMARAAGETIRVGVKVHRTRRARIRR